MECFFKQSHACGSICARFVVMSAIIAVKQVVVKTLSIDDAGAAALNSVAHLRADALLEFRRASELFKHRLWHSEPSSINFCISTFSNNTGEIFRNININCWSTSALFLLDSISATSSFSSIGGEGTAAA